MSLRQSMTDRLASTELGRKIVSEPRFRAIWMTAFGLLCNFLYALYHGILGALNLSMWFSAMCAYYIILGAMRFFAVRCGRKAGAAPDLETEYFVMKLSGVLLVMLSFVLSGVIYVSLSQNIATRYGEIVMITIAACTFYKITLAIIRAVRQRNNPSPLLAVIRNISYAEVAASVLTLQRSMLVSFGGMSREGIHSMNAMTGAAVCAFVLLLGIYMIVRGVKKGELHMARSKLVEANEKIAEKVTSAYKHIENTAVNSYTKIEDAFVDRYLTRDGETVEEAKKRLKNRDSAEK